MVLLVIGLPLVSLVVALIAAAAPDSQVCDVDSTATCKITATPSQFQPALLNASKWIWSGENPIPGGSNIISTRPFRKNITAPCGKCAVCATIVVASDDAHTFYVNGVRIGTGAGFRQGQALFVALQPTWNLFAIAGQNLVANSPAGIMASILVHFSDGTSETFVTDESWKTLRAAPPENFQLPSTNDSNWSSAAVQGAYQNSVWGPPVLPPVLPLRGSNWIWTSDNVNGAAPVGSRAFRKTVNQCTKVAVCATVLIAADDRYALYVNGATVGSGSSYTVADAYTIPNLHPTFNTFAINATNGGGPAGVIATIIITYSDGSNETVVTDASWKAIQTIPQGFQLPLIDEFGWESAKIIGAFGVAPWGTGMVIPSA